MLVFHDLKRLQPNRSGQRIATKGRAVAAGREHIHHGAVSHKRTDGQQPAAQRFPQNQPIGPNTLVFKGKPAPGAA